VFITKKGTEDTSAWYKITYLNYCWLHYFKIWWNEYK